MSNQTQQQIDTLIQIINDAEEPGTVTNLIVAAVLAFLADKVKTMATASALSAEVSALETVDASLNQAIQNEATARQAADTTLSDRISSLQVALDRLMSGNVSETIESFNEVINFLNEVTDDETLTGLLSQINNRIASVEDDLAAKADLNRYTNKLAYGQVPDVVLATMGDALDNVNNSGATIHYVPVAGDTYWDSTSRTIKYIDVGGTTRDLEAPKSGLVYCNKRTDLTYRWDAASGWKQVGGGPGSAIDIVNNLVSGGIAKALSAEQGKELKQKIIEVQNNVERLYNALGNAAFWNAQSKADGAPVELDWSTSKHTVALNSSLVTAGKAVIKDGNNNILGSSFLVEEGADFTLKVEGINGWSLSNIQVSGATPKSSSGGTFVFSMGTSNMNITISGTADKEVNVSKTLTGCEVVANSETSPVVTGSAYSVTIKPTGSNTFTDVTATMDNNGATVNLAQENNQDGSKTISTQSVTGDITIAATAAGVMVEDMIYKENYPNQLVSDGGIGAQSNTHYIDISGYSELLYVFGAKNTSVNQFGMELYDSGKEFVRFNNANNRNGYREISGSTYLPPESKYARCSFWKSSAFRVATNNQYYPAQGNFQEAESGPYYGAGLYGRVSSSSEWVCLFDASPYVPIVSSTTSE